MIKRILELILGIISGVLFLMVKQPTLLIFSLFLITLSFHDPLQRLSSRINMPLLIKLIILMVLIGLITELLAIWNNAGLTAEQIMDQNRLYSPNPLMDIILGWGYYVPLAIVWFFLLRRFDYAIHDVFITMGIFGIFFEGIGLVLLSLDPLKWAYAFTVHGSYMAIAYIITKKDPLFSRQMPLPRLKKYLYGFFYSMLTFVTFIIWKYIIG